jgi:hypothetical protein
MDWAQHSSVPRQIQAFHKVSDTVKKTEGTCATQATLQPKLVVVTSKPLRVLPAIWTLRLLSASSCHQLVEDSFEKHDPQFI